MTRQDGQLNFQEKLNQIFDEWDSLASLEITQKYRELLDLERKRASCQPQILQNSSVGQVLNEQNFCENIWDSNEIRAKIDQVIAKASRARIAELKVREAESLVKNAEQQEIEAKKAEQQKLEVKQPDCIDSGIQNVLAALPEDSSLSNSKNMQRDCCKELESNLQIITRLKRHNVQIFQDVDIKNQCYMYKRKITIKVGQVTNSKARIFQLYSELDSLLREMPTLQYNWSLNFVCKAIVRQAETEVSATQKMAFPIGMLCCLLCKSHTDFGKFLMARFCKKCPWVVPCLHSSDMRVLGFKRKANDWEDFSSYIERECGIFSVYVAINQCWVSDCPPSLFGMKNQWTFLARIVNNYHKSIALSEYVVLPMFAILCTFLELSTDSLLKIYRKQAFKLIECLFSINWHQICNKSCSTLVRLNLLGEKFRSKNFVGTQHIFDS